MTPPPVRSDRRISSDFASQTGYGVISGTSSFEVTEHGGIDPQRESARFVAKHLSAYYLALKYAKGKVLEIGSGDGYGSSLLADHAQDVTGIDLFESNVRIASAKYIKKNLKFLQMNATNLDFNKQYFDLIVSFQVIEHIPQAQLPVYIEQIKKVLSKNGTVCLSTLNLNKNLKPGQPYDKAPHHDKEFTPEEFRFFLKPFFKQVTLHGLYPTFKHAFMERLKKSGLFRAMPRKLDPVQSFYKGITVKDFKWISKTSIDDCLDLMAVCHN